MPAGDQKVIGPIAPEQRPQRASASARRANPRDLTGKRKQELEAQVAEEREEAARQMATATAAARRTRTEEIVDYTKGGASSPSVASENAPVISEEPEVEVEELFVRIRVNAPIEDMVFGRQINPGDPEQGIPDTPGNLNYYNFEEGRAYDVPKALADHLERIGYIYH